MKLSILIAVLLIYATIAYVCRPIELSGRDEMKTALKNYTLITK